jgi:hypothetical protein
MLLPLYMEDGPEDITFQQKKLQARPNVSMLQPKVPSSFPCSTFQVVFALQEWIDNKRLTHRGAPYSLESPVPSNVYTSYKLNQHVQSIQPVELVSGQLFPVPLLHALVDLVEHSC